jgi:hypothetical protein
MNTSTVFIVPYLDYIVSCFAAKVNDFLNNYWISLKATVA